MKVAIERRLLQGSVAIGALVPIGAGGVGAVHGLAATSTAGESHARYLSGLLLGIGLAFWATIPTIERRGEIIRLLGAIVVLGGLARLAATPSTGFGMNVSLPLIMELVVTPSLVLWRERVERRYRRQTEQA